MTWQLNLNRGRKQMKTKTIKEARDCKDNKDKKFVLFTQIRQARMVILPIQENEISVDEIIDGLNKGIFTLYDNEFVVLTSTVEDDEPKVIANLRSFDTYFGEIVEKDFKKL